jgi:hypothetical protein
MSASPQLIFTSISQWRNAEISALVNRADPFLAIICAKCMNAQLPPEYRLDAKDMKLKEPETRSWNEDPDQQILVTEAWSYVKEYVIALEEKFAAYVSSGMTARQFS